MRLSITVWICCLVARVHAAPTRPPSAVWGVVARQLLPTATSRRRMLSLLRGGATSDYVAQLESVQTQVIQKAGTEIEALRQTIVEEGRIVPDYGKQADLICNQALQDFTATAPAIPDDSQAAAYDKSLQQLETALDAPLQVLYLKQLALIRQKTLADYRAATASGSSGSNYEAMLNADAQFVAAAEASTRPGADWEYATERSFLQAVMNNLAVAEQAAATVKMNSAQQQQTAMQFLQSQQQMIQQLQMQLYGQTSPWNVGVAYRIPDTNFNLQGSYQQGRANVQLSCVPDEYAPFLGPNGFTNGVGPGNLGLSLNLSI